MPKPVDSDAIRDLVRRVDDNIQLPAEPFFRLLDEEKSRLARKIPWRGELRAKLHATRIINLLVNKHEYFRCAIKKVGRPSGFMLDPANACQLGCPTCQHSFNKTYTAQTYVPMPKGILRPKIFDPFIEELGPYTYAGHFYNNSEPFLNKHLCDYLAKANLYRINTFISSNLSVPNIDVDAVVGSGLNTLMVAIDGTTQQVYEKYRRGGKLELVFENVAKIAAAKRRLGSAVPHLRWQFLTFQHNIHQVDAAIEIARKLGFDSFNVATPYDVAGDEPSIDVAVHPLVEGGRATITFTTDPPTTWARPLNPIADVIERAFSESLLKRFQDHGVESSTGDTPKFGYCDWLHVGLIADALGRILPCCIPDYAGHGSFVFGSVDGNTGNLYNSERYLQARQLLADPSTSEQPRGANGDRMRRSKCEGCRTRPLPQIGLGAAATYLSVPAADLYGQWMTPEVISRLTGWSRHSFTFD